jgi:putative nucleotidyltransferase with HDIG domain
VHTDQPNVLIVDDEPHVAELLADGLAVQGFRCFSVTDVRQARRMLLRRSFDVLVVDVYMPGASGLELLVYTRKVAPQAKVILISGVASTESLAEALHLGAYDYFQKPLDIAQLARSLREAVEGTGHSSQLPLRAAKAMRLEAQVAHSSLESIGALAHAVEARDPYTGRHSEQVAHYATRLAAFLKLPKARIDRIRTASLLHDIGKIGVPDRILTKPGALTEEEFAEIRRHPRLGAEILEKISMLAEEARLVRSHHERWDGSGYPEGLAGDEIPVGAQIIHLADAMDAMLMERTYKPPFPVPKVLAELRRCAGGHFAPQLSHAAIEWCRENQEQLILPPAAA